MARLVDLGEVQTGTTPTTKKRENYGNYIPFVKPADFKEDGTIDISGQGLSRVGLESGRLVESNSVLMVCIGATIGKTGYTEAPVSCNQQINAFTPGKGLCTKYCYYFLSSDFFYRKVLLESSQATLPIINKTKWGNLSVSYPKSLETQKQIVEILDEAFDAIDRAKANLEKNLENARALYESYLRSILENPNENWEYERLGDIFDIKHGFAFKSKFFVDDGDYVLLTPGNFYESGGYRDRGDKQKYYDGEIPDGFILDEGNLLIAMTEQAAGLLGSPIIVPESNRFLHNQRLGLIVVRDGQEIELSFLFHLFNTPRIRSLIHESASGIKVRHTSPKKVMALKAHIPPIAKQREIAEKLNTVSIEAKKLEPIYQQKLDNLEELKKSLLQKAFSGELTSSMAEVGV